MGALIYLILHAGESLRHGSTRMPRSRIMTFINLSRVMGSKLMPARDVMADLQIAVRNLARNRRRALIALLTVAAGVIAMILADGFIQWIYWAMREATIQSQLGHIQIVRPGYHQAGVAAPYDYLLPDRSPVRDAVEATPGVSLVAPRMAVTGLISHGDTTVSFIADGGPSGTRLSKALHCGGPQSPAATPGSHPGRGLARTLGIGPGALWSRCWSPARRGINAVGWVSGVSSAPIRPTTMRGPAPADTVADPAARPGRLTSAGSA
jgi:hypothetical protein